MEKLTKATRRGGWAPELGSRGPRRRSSGRGRIRNVALDPGNLVLLVELMEDCKLRLAKEIEVEKVEA